MEDIAIRAEGLSKEYRIGGKQEGYKTLRDTLGDTLVAPFRRAGNLLRGQATGAAELNEGSWALKEPSMEIKQGEVVGIIGRNGAGKTTLLKILSRITEPTGGYVEIRGRVGTLLEVGTGFHPELTGRENIYLSAAILGMKKVEIDHKFDEIVTFAEVEKFLDTPVKHYSTGMYVRLAFAVAAHLEPDILLVDEVLSVGDAGFQKKCLGAMDELRQAGRTVVMVSHNMSAIENLCSRALYIEDGTIKRDGSAREVIKDYLSTFAGCQQTELDLREVQRRRGSGTIRYTRLEFLRPDRTNAKLIRCGDSLIVRLHYHAYEAVPNPHFGLELYTEVGAKVTTIHTWMTGYEIPFLLPGDGHIDLEIDFLNVTPGRYYITLKLEAIGPVHYDMLDHCATMDVETSDFYKSGKGIEERMGVLFLPCRWKLDG